MTGHNKPLIIGIGNPVRGDDAFGALVVSDLKSNHPHMAEYMFFNADMTNLIDKWVGRDVILIDLIVSEKLRGQISVANSMEELMLQKETILTSHGLGLAEIIQLSQLLDKKPRSFFFIGVSGNNFQINAPIGVPVRALIPEVIDKVKAYITQLLNQEKDFD